MTNIMKRVDELCTKHGISRYRLSQNTGISQSAFSKMDRQQATLSLETIERICAAFGISLAQFFTQETTCPDLTPDQTRLLDVWLRLDSPKRDFALSMMEELLKI
ncbi:MAG: helix-turn-helix transcriptional regulator [Clostridiales bacterium]|nr:helix-turn-helix transcriptional regulator [Clostridiales bacterium]